MRIKPLLLLVSFMAPLACASAKPKVEAKPVAPLPPPRVEKMREPLEVTPLELHFSGQRGVTTAVESVAVRNTGNEPVQVSELRVVGLQPEAFKIATVPLLPLVLQPTASFSFTVGFEPAADAEPGVHHARVRLVRTEDDDGPPCDLTGLVTKGKEAQDEPPLVQVLDALGYDIDVGGATLALPAKPAGDQIPASLWERAKPGNVGYYLIARYAAAEDVLFGYYVNEAGKPVTHGMGSAGKAHNQTLNPELSGESRTSFDLGEAKFGLYLKVGKRTLYSDERGNAGAAAARAYPLRSRGRTLVPDAFVVAFDEDRDGDFQDDVFMLWNVKPAQ
ncbi:MAG: hypothetical protein JXP73_01725 [Deltaproteobacteria bacterium]|jgi:hypothetical protein|nr:hypothetical protein [Deltaproteobacteria bacterium]